MRRRPRSNPTKGMYALALNIHWASVYTPLSEDFGPCLLASRSCCEGAVRQDQTLST